MVSADAGAGGGIMRVSIAKNLFGMLVLMPWLISLFLIGTNSEAVCSDEMQVIGAFSIDKTEVSIEQFNDFAKSLCFSRWLKQIGALSGSIKHKVF